MPRNKQLCNKFNDLGVLLQRKIQHKKRLSSVESLSTCGIRVMYPYCKGESDEERSQQPHIDRFRLSLRRTRGELPLEALKSGYFFVTEATILSTNVCQKPTIHKISEAAIMNWSRADLHCDQQSILSSESRRFSVLLPERLVFLPVSFPDSFPFSLRLSF